MKKLVVSSILLCNLLYASNSISPYINSAKYSDESAKNSSTYYGLFGKYSSNTYFIEYGIGNKNTKYKTKEALTQTDTTVVYNQYMGTDFIARVGLHYIKSNDKVVDAGRIFIIGAKKLNGDSSEMGVDFYYSYYASTTEFSVMQISPFVGVGFETSYVPGSFYLKGTYNIITPQKHPTATGTKFLKLSLSNKYKALTTTISTNFLGNEQILVDRGGFLADTTTDEYTSNLGISFKYKVSRKYSLEAKARKFEFTDADNAQKATGTSYSLNLNIEF